MVTYLRFRDLKARGIVNTWPTLKSRIERAGFPPGQKLGPNTRAWREDEVQAWLDSRPTEFSLPQALRGAALKRKRKAERATAANAAFATDR
jgi:Prophage CP4-57 regulatory protein (AlpA)